MPPVTLWAPEKRVPGLYLAAITVVVLVAVLVAILIAILILILVIVLAAVLILISVLIVHICFLRNKLAGFRYSSLP